VINALDGAVYGPTYRGGILRGRALERLAELEASSSVPSVAFEMLGPPRLSKLLFEAHLLGLVAGSMTGVIDGDATALARAMEMLISTNGDLRSRIISIGIPILLCDGSTLLRGETVKIPPFRGEWELEITDESKRGWADAGWVDLRADNVVRWQERLRRIRDDAESIDPSDTSSRHNFSREHWEHFRTMPIGKIVAWVFTVEDEGARMKA
jgi:hypothetical protein